MSYITQRGRSFGDFSNLFAGRLPTRKRSEGRLKKFDSCTDCRAWNVDERVKVLYLLDLVNAPSGGDSGVDDFEGSELGANDLEVGLMSKDKTIEDLQNRLNEKDNYLREALRKLEDIHVVVKENEHLRNELKSSEEKIQIMKEQSEHMIRSLAALPGEIEALDQARANAKSPEEELAVCIKEIDQLKKYSGGLTGIQEENKSLRAQLEACRDAEKQIATMTYDEDKSDDVEYLHRLVAELRSTVNSLTPMKKERDGLRQELTRLNKRIREVDDNYTAEVATLRKRSQMLNNVVTERDDIRKQLDKYEGMDERIRELLRLAAELEKIKRERDALLSRLNECEREHAEFLAEYERAVNHMGGMEEDHDKLMQRLNECEQIEMELERLRFRANEYEMIKMERDQLLAQLKDLEGIMSERDMYKNKYEEMSEIEDCMINQLQYYKSADEECNCLRNQLQQAESAINEQEEEISLLIANIELLNSAQYQKNSQLLGMETELEDTSSELCRCRSELSGMESLKDELRSIQEEMEEAIQKVQFEKHSVIKELDVTKATLNNRNDEITKINNLLTHLHIDRRQSIEEADTTEKRILKLIKYQSENAKLKDEISRIKSGDCPCGHISTMLKQTKCTIQIVIQEINKMDLSRKPGATVDEALSCSTLKDLASRLKAVINTNKLLRDEVDRLRAAAGTLGSVGIGSNDLLQQRIEGSNSSESFDGISSNDLLQLRGSNSSANFDSNMQAEIDRLLAELKTCSDEKSKLQNQLDELSNKHEVEAVLSSDSDELVRLKAEVNRLQSELASSENEKKNLKSQLDELTVENSRLTSDMNQCGTDKANLQSQLDQITADVNRLQSEVTKCGTDKEALQKQLDQNMEENTRSQTELNQYSTDKAALQTQLDQNNAENARLQTELNQCSTDKSALQTQLDQNNAENARLQSELTKCSTDKNVVQAQLDEIKVENNQLKLELNKCSSDKGALQTQLDQSKSDINRLQSELNQCSKEKQTLETELGQIQSEISRLLSELKQCTAAQEALQTKLTQMSAENTRLQSDLNQCATDKGTLHLQINQLQSDIEKLEAEKLNINSIIDKLKSDFETKNKQVANEASEKEKLSMENSVLQNDLKDAKDKLNSLLADSEKLQNELSALKADKEKSQNELNALRTEKEKAENELTSLKNELDASKVSNSKCQSDLKSLKDELNAIKAEAEKFKREVNELHDLMAENTKRANKIESTLKAEIEQLRKELIDLNKIIEEKTAMFNKVVAERDAIKSEAEALKRKEEALQKDITDLKAGNALLKNEMNVLKDAMAKKAAEGNNELDKERHERENCQKLVDDLKAQINGLNDKIKSIPPPISTKSFADEIKKLTEDLEAAHKRIADLESQIRRIKEDTAAAKIASEKDLMDKLTKAQAALAAEEDASAGRMQEIMALTKKNNDLQNEKKGLNNEINQLKKKLAEAQDQVKSLKNIIDELKKSLAESQSKLKKNVDKKSETKLVDSNVVGGPNKEAMNKLERECQAKLDALEAKLRAEMANKEKQYNENLKSLKTKYERDVRNIKKEHHDGIKRMSSFHEDVVKEQVKNYEIENENLQIQKEKLTHDIKRTRKCLCDLELQNRELKNAMIKPDTSETGTLTDSQQAELESQPDLPLQKICKCPYAMTDDEIQSLGTSPSMEALLNKILQDGMEALSFQELKFLHTRTCNASQEIRRRSRSRSRARSRSPDTCPGVKGRPPSAKSGRSRASTRSRSPKREQPIPKQRIASQEAEILRKQKITQQKLVTLEKDLQDEKTMLIELRDALALEKEMNVGLQKQLLHSACKCKDGQKIHAADVDLQRAKCAVVQLQTMLTNEKEKALREKRRDAHTIQALRKKIDSAKLAPCKCPPRCAPCCMPQQPPCAPCAGPVFGGNKHQF